MTREITELCRKASETFSNLDFLTKRDEFREFIEIFERRAASIAEEILENDDISADEREKLRQIRKGILEVINFPAEEMAASRRVIASHFPDGMEGED